jgi:hypothetical protein
MARVVDGDPTGDPERNLAEHVLCVEALSQMVGVAEALRTRGI